MLGLLIFCQLLNLYVTNLHVARPPTSLVRYISLFETNYKIYQLAFKISLIWTQSYNGLIYAT